MTQRFRLALVVLIALAVVTLSVWLLKGGLDGRGAGVGGDGEHVAPDKSGGALLVPRDPADGEPGGGNGGPSAIPGGMLQPGGPRVPSGIDLSDPKQRRAYLADLLSKVPVDWEAVAGVVAITTEPLDPAAREAILTAMKSGDRNGASKALMVTHDPAFVPDLLAVLDDLTAPEGARRVALLALGQMPGGDRDEIAKALESRLKGEMSPDFEVLDAIARRGGRESARAVVQYVERSSEAERAWQALSGRMDLKDPEVAAIVAEALTRTQSPGALETLLRVAGEPGAAGLAPALIALDREDVSETHRALVYDALAHVGTGDAMGHLLQVSRQPGVYGEKALLALSAVRSATDEARAALVNELERAALNPRPEMAKATLLLAVGRLQVKEALPRVVESLRDPSDEVRNSAIRAVGLMKSAARPHVGEIARLFQEGNQATRGSVATALGNIGGPEATKHLEEFLKDTTLDSSLRRTIGFAAETARAGGAAGDPDAPR
jgi:HEAT repeat protein